MFSQDEPYGSHYGASPVREVLAAPNMSRWDRPSQSQTFRPIPPFAPRISPESPFIEQSSTRIREPPRVAPGGSFVGEPWRKCIAGSCIIMRAHLVRSLSLSLHHFRLSSADSVHSTTPYHAFGFEWLALVCVSLSVKSMSSLLDLLILASEGGRSLLRLDPLSPSSVRIGWRYLENEHAGDKMVS